MCRSCGYLKTILTGHIIKVIAGRSKATTRQSPSVIKVETFSRKEIAAPQKTGLARTVLTGEASPVIARELATAAISERGCNWVFNEATTHLETYFPVKSYRYSRNGMCI